MPSDTTTDTDLTGRTVGHFRIEAKLGEGGMGVVFRATDSKLGRSVALKLLGRALVATETLRARFLREARAAAAVTHPNIATVYEVGESDEHVYIAMELVHGRSVRELLHSGALAPEVAVAIALDLLDALACAHEAGIVHRDIKPDNVMVDERGRAKLLDFGVAKALAADAADVARGDGVATLGAFHTHEGAIVGTPGYMAPEQASGGSVDPRTDLFSLGVVLHEMLTGESPFARETPMASVFAVLNDVAPSVAVSRPDLPGDLVSVVDRSTKKDVQERWPSAPAMEAALRATRVGAKWGARPMVRRPEDAGAENALSLAQTIEAPTRPLPRGRSRWLAPSLLLAIGVAAGTVWWSRQTPEPARPAVRGASAAVPASTTDRPLPRISVRALTANPSADWVVSAHLVDDGRTLFYQHDAGIFVLPLDGSEPERIDLPAGAPPRLFGVASSGRVLLLGDVERREPLKLYDRGTGTLRPAAPPTLLAALSPDGGRIAYLGEAGLVVAPIGSDTGRVVATLEEGDDIGQLSWSPDGARLAYVRLRPDGGQSTGRLELAETTARTAPRLLLQDVRLVLRGGTGATAFWTATRLLYFLAGPAAGTHATELWAQRLAVDGSPVGAPLALHEWAEGTPVEPERSGDRLVFLEMRTQSDIWSGELSADARALARVVRVTTDERNDVPSGWTVGGDLLFMSTRFGTWDVFVRRGATEQRLVGGPTWDTYPIALDDGVLFFQLALEPSGAVTRCQLARRHEDGTITALFETRSESTITLAGRAPPSASVFRCRRDRCLLSEPDGDDLAFRSFDPVSGAREERACRMRAPTGRYQWDLSPDAATVALVASGLDLVLLDLRSCESHAVRVVEQGALTFVAWLPSGERLVLSGVHALGQRYVLFSTDRAGREQAILHTSTSSNLGAPTVSPDGRTLAFSGQEYDVDAWALDGLEELDGPAAQR